MVSEDGLVVDFTCDCPDSHMGRRCEVEINDPCGDIAPCQNGATCSNVVSEQGVDFTCNCPKGYMGNTCETDIDECMSNPCVNGGSCQVCLMLVQR